MEAKSAKTKTLEVVTAPRERPTLRFTKKDDANLHVDYEGDFAPLAKAVGGANVIDGMLSQFASLGSKGNSFDERASNFAVGFVDAMKPKDAAEALLLGQMATLHQATMMMARRLNQVDTIQQQDSVERSFNKLARSYATQMETLKRYRSKGKQTVRVERVTVQDGGQAIVGQVKTGGRAHDKR